MNERQKVFQGIFFYIIYALDFHIKMLRGQFVPVFASHVLVYLLFTSFFLLLEGFSEEGFVDQLRYVLLSGQC